MKAWIGLPWEDLVEATRLDLVKLWVRAGYDVRVVTAKVSPERLREAGRDWWAGAMPIMEWCVEHIGCILPVTHETDVDMVPLKDTSWIIR
jgi:hypothetical protein